MAEFDGVQGHVKKSLPTFVKKPLNLTSKQIEEKKVKKSMVLVWV